MGVRWLIGITLVCAAGGGCGGDRAPAASPTRTRDDARAVLGRHCGSCHRASLPTAKLGALAVFDLDRPDFSATMSDVQLRDALHRLENLRDIDDPVFVGPTRADAVGQFRAFVDQELAARASRGIDRRQRR